MISLLYGALSFGLIVADVHTIHPYDLIWDVGTQYSDLSIAVDDYVEFYTAIPIHNVYIGEKNRTFHADTLVANCDATDINNYFTLASLITAADVEAACNTWPLCSFVSGPESCLVTKPAVCAGVPDLIVRIRQQFTAPGTYFAVCTADAGEHCQQGMHVQINVEGGGQQQDQDRTPVVHWLTTDPETWGLARYHDFNVEVGDQVRFKINTLIHDLQLKVVTSTPDESGDCPADTSTSTALVAQNNAAADGASVTFNWSPTQAGTYLLWCSQGFGGFHCSFGMHFRVTVVPAPPPKSHHGD